MKTLFEQLGGTYTMQGDYRLPNLAVDETDIRPIGIWGQRRLNYLKHHRKLLYYNLLTSGKLHSHLADIEEQAQDLFSQLVNEHIEKEKTTVKVNVSNQVIGVRKMNNIRERVIEVVNAEVIFV